MNCIQYNSVPTVKSSKRKSKNPVSQLAEETFEAFRPFINIFDCGAKDYEGSPVHSITREDWRLHRRYKKGERGLSYPDGRKFNPFLDIVANIYSPRHVHRHIERAEVTYYTSGRNGRGVLYLDIDAHHPWQTDEYEAKRILQDLFPFGYFRASRRGQNGFLKLRYDTAEQFNDLAARLERTLKRYFLTLGVLCDIEIKGTITTKDKAGSLAKFPFTTARCPCHKRDETDHWNEDQLQKFKNCPTVNLRRVEVIRSEIESQVNEEKAVKFAAHKKSLDEQAGPARKLVTLALAALGMSPTRTNHPVVAALVRPFLNTFQRREGRLPTTDEALDWLKATGRYKGNEPVPQVPTSANDVQPVVTRQVRPSARPCTVRVRTELPPQISDDAFRRNLEDLRPFVRAFYPQHHRFPTAEEASLWLQENHRYSGEWEDNLTRRTKRVQQILEFTERTFDPEMLGSGEGCPVSLNRDRFSWWVRQTFGSTMTAHVRDLRRFDATTMTGQGDGLWGLGSINTTVSTTTVSIPARFVETFLVVAEFCTRQDPLSNKAVPTNRIKKLWSMVKDGAAWNQKYYQIVRNRLHQMRVVQIFDRQHHVGKAWRWSLGDDFPERSLRDQQRKLKAKCQLPSGDPVSLVEFLAGMTGTTTQHLHNTLYYVESGFSAISPPEPMVRPPP